MINIKEIIRKEVESVLVERAISIPLSLVMPDFSCPCEPDDLGRLYVLQYTLPNPVRGMKGIIMFVTSQDDTYKIDTTPIKTAPGGLGTRQYAVYNSLKRKVGEYYQNSLIGSGWERKCDDNLSDYYSPPWSS